MRRLLLLALLMGWQPAVHSADDLPPGLMALDGRPAPALKLADMDGQVTDLRTLRGRWVLVHFWASWCGPCRKEMPSLQRLSGKLGPRGPVLLLVNTAEPDDTVFSFLAIVAPDLTTLMDRDGQVTEVWQPRGLPASFLVDPGGRLRYLALGGRPWETPPYVRFLSRLTSGDAPGPPPQAR